MIYFFAKQFWTNFIEIYSLAKIQKKNKTCLFYKGSKISNSSFGKFNVVFENVKIINSKIDNDTYVQERTKIFNSEIGSFCSIGPNVSIGPGSHKINLVSTHPAFYQKNSSLLRTFSDTDSNFRQKKTIIGNDVWIGEGSIIIDGVKIGNGSVIAAGAVVTKNVSPYSIVGGVPAKIIKFRFDKETIINLEKSKWWNFEEKWFYENSKLMLNTSKFIKYLKDG